MSLSPPRSIGPVPTVTGPIRVSEEPRCRSDRPSLGNRASTSISTGRLRGGGVVARGDRRRRGPRRHRARGRRALRHARARTAPGRPRAVQRRGVRRAVPQPQRGQPAWTSEHRYLSRDGHAWIGLTVNSGRSGLLAHHAAEESRSCASSTPRCGTLRLLAFEHGPTRGAAGPRRVRSRAHAVAARPSRPPCRARNRGGAVRHAEAQRREQPARGARRRPCVRDRLVADRTLPPAVPRPRVPRGDGRAPSADGEPGPVVDGYLIVVGPVPEHRPADAVLVNLLSEGEVVGTLNPGFTVADDTERRASVATRCRARSTTGR